MLTQAKRNCYTLLIIACISISFPLLRVNQGWGQESVDKEPSSYIEQLKNDDDWRKRSQAASALGKISLEPAISALITALKTEQDEVVRLRATFALIEIGLPAVPELIETLKVDNLSARYSACLALSEIGLSALDDLTGELERELEKLEKLENPPNLELIRTNAACVAPKIAKKYQSQAESLSMSDLEKVISYLKTAQNTISSFPNIENNTNPSDAGFKQEDIETIRESLTILNDERRCRRLYQISQIFITFVLLSIIGGIIIIIRRRPDLILRFSRVLVQSKEQNERFDHFRSQVQQFCQHTGATTSRQGKRSLKLTSIPGRLKSYTPLPIMLTLDQPVAEDVTELVKQSSQLTGNSQQKAGIMLYREPPDTLFRMRMAEVRLRDHFILIPIPFAAIEQALLDSSIASGLLAQYTDRYLPGADLFNDRNAIGDTLSFFGRVELLNRLEEELRRNQGIGLFGLRKSGKTSILLQLSFAMRQHPVVYIDLQSYGGKQRYGAELLNQVLQQLIKLVNEHHPQSKSANLNWFRSRHFSARSAKALTTNSVRSAKALTTNFKPFPQDSPAPDLISEFTQHINTLSPLLQEAGYHLPILCFLDEIERILPTKTDAKERTEEFNACFGVLRVLSQEQRQLSLLVADVHADCNRINQWQQLDVPTNPVFSFFKEYFVSPFSQSETTRMLTDIGELMGVTFDQATQIAIHRESGGHPFIARQLASLLYERVALENKGEINLSAAQRYLNKPFTYSGFLKDYFSQNIWADLDKRHFTCAIALLKLLTCTQETQPQITEEALFARLNPEFTESQCLDALLWLEAVGLIHRDAIADKDYYQLQVPLLSRWLRMQMKPEEMQQWQL
ncbi:HEAT repeat domain-containing protein [Coleofasciculus chthonoplastes]|uniref:HEAT repeat domain-containing protein n=1 Tax=Coleofasciculus chthonoplastes TaxID=64178 RepID=UPI0032F1ADDF